MSWPHNSETARTHPASGPLLLPTPRDGRHMGYAAGVASLGQQTPPVLTVTGTTTLPGNVTVAALIALQTVPSWPCRVVTWPCRVVTWPFNVVMTVLALSVVV